MNTYLENYHTLIRNAHEALKRGDRHFARQLAEQAVEIAPDSEEPWLILAAISSPKDSVNYLNHALRINPKSERARKGMHWAAGRLRKEQRDTIDQEATAPHKFDDKPSYNPLQRTIERTAPSSNITQPVSPRSQSSRTANRYRWSFAIILIMAVCLTAAWAFWPGNASPVLALIRSPKTSLPIPEVLANVFLPTSTPSPTSTFTPTATWTPSPTNTATPTATATSTPTPTYTPTETATPIPTSTDTPWPTDTPEPIVQNNGGDSTKWIDVDLSQQMLYAYQGNTIIASFLVSTGVAQFPTVTGQYHTYVKYRYTLMQGDGYYLPDVPYTMYFYKGYGIHGTYWHNNFGHPMSHGCVNMYTPDAEWLYYWSPLGILVNIHY